jgi:hypothetical protein
MGTLATKVCESASMLKTAYDTLYVASNGAEGNNSWEIAFVVLLEVLLETF